MKNSNVTETLLALGALAILYGGIAAPSAQAGGGKVSPAEVDALVTVYRQHLATPSGGRVPKATDSPGGGSLRAILPPFPGPDATAAQGEEVPRLTAFSPVSLAASGGPSLWANTDANGGPESITQGTDTSEESDDAAGNGRQWFKFPGGPAPASDGATGPGLQEASLAPAERWRFKVIPYVWMPTVDGSVTARGTKMPVFLSKSDLVRLADEIDVVVPLQVEARHGRWKLWLDVQYYKLHDRRRQSLSKQVGPILVTADATINVNMRMLLTEFGVDYELFEVPLSEDQGRKLRFDVRAGGRYIYMKGEVGIAIQGAAQIGPGDAMVPIGGLAVDSGGSRQWIEPLVGAGVSLDLSDRLTLMARGDIGGFGIGSDLTWQVVGGVEWKLCNWASIFAGYRLLDIDFEEGSGAEKFAFDVQMRGPYLAAIFSF